MGSADVSENHSREHVRGWWEVFDRSLLEASRVECTAGSDRDDGDLGHEDRGPPVNTGRRQEMPIESQNPHPVPQRMSDKDGAPRFYSPDRLFSLDPRSSLPSDGLIRCGGRAWVRCSQLVLRE